MADEDALNYLFRMRTCAERWMGYHNRRMVVEGPKPTEKHLGPPRGDLRVCVCVCGFE